TKDQSVQADAFFPNELWIFEGDSIKWTFVPKNEVHTVTLLTPGQIRPSAPPPAGPPFAVQGVNCGPAATYDGSACVSTAAGLNGGATFTVTFPKAGNYKMVCLIHTDMTGTVHVLVNNAANGALVHGQRHIDDVAHDEAQAILSDNDHQGDEDHRGWNDRRDRDHEVIAGIGEIVATGGGRQYRAVVRFLPGTIRIHAGDSVVWTNLDPTEPHTVTFGTEPAGFVPTLYSLPPALVPAPGPPIPNPPAPCTSLVATDCKDTDTGTVIGTINCTAAPPSTAGTTPCNAAFTPQGDSVTPPPPAYAQFSFLNSGFLQAAIPDRTGTAQVPSGTTRIRITFPKKGNYYYHCALHDVDGMNGEVIVE
ncbi:MAG: cupredoxin domain-containing protein, partial [Bryobacteraceae bacterium]